MGFNIYIYIGNSSSLTIIRLLLFVFAESRVLSTLNPHWRSVCWSVNPSYQWRIGGDRWCALCSELKSERAVETGSRAQKHNIHTHRQTHRFILYGPHCVSCGHGVIINAQFNPMDWMQWLLLWICEFHAQTLRRENVEVHELVCLSAGFVQDRVFTEQGKRKHTADGFLTSSTHFIFQDFRASLY